MSEKASGQPRDAPVEPPRRSPAEATMPYEARPENGAWLVEAFIARKPSSDTEIVLQLNRLLYRVFKQRWGGLRLRYHDLRGDCFILLDYWRESGRLRVEPLAWLAQRLMKQCARQQVRDNVKDKRLLRLDAAFGTTREARKLERKISEQYGWRNPEQELLANELLAWLIAVRVRLSLQERDTYDAALSLAEGEVKSLHQALGIKDAAARQRLSRMRATIAELARKDGMSQVVDRWKKGRAPRRDRKAR